MNQLKSKLSQTNDELNQQIDPNDFMSYSQQPPQNAVQRYDQGSAYGQSQGFVRHNNYGYQGPPTVFQGGPSHHGPPAVSYAPTQGHDAGYRYPSPNNHAFAPPNGHYPPPPTQQQQCGHTSHPQFPTMSHPTWNPGSSRLNFPSRCTIWKQYVKGATYLGIGANKDDDLWYAKWPSSGNLTISQGSPKDKGGNEIGQTKYVGMSGTRIAITMSNGFSCELKKGSMLSSSGSGYHLTMDVEGAGQQTFVWKAKSGGLVGKLTGAGGGFNLYRQGDTEAPLATYVQSATSYSGYSSRTELGQFEFVGEGATGLLGNNFTQVAVVTILKIIQREKDMKVLKAVLKGS